MQADEASWTSLIPALVAIALALGTRQVVLSLFVAILSGSLVLFAHTGAWADLNFLQRFLLPALGTSAYAKILLVYLWCLGGLIGVWERTGGALHFARVVGGAVAKGPRSSMVFAWLLGCVFHQGGTVSTVLAGTTVKPVADAHRVSHEELAYIVDSTASPVATILPFNAWPGFVAALVAGTIPLLPDETSGLRFFFASLPYNFYGWFAVASTLLLALGLHPWPGAALSRARDRARATGALDAPNARPLLPPSEASRVPAGYAPSLADFLVPIGALLALAVIPYTLLGVDFINEAFLACTGSAILLAVLRGMRVSEVMDGFMDGCSRMTLGAVLLGLAVTMGKVAKDLHAASVLTDALGGQIPAWLLPPALMLLCMGIAFSTGTSWGTYAVVFPVAMPLAFALSPDPTYLSVCFGAVIGGAVFGDQCSPISDTTILSSMFTGCDLMDHVTTQLPPALLAAGLAMLASAAAAAWSLGLA